MQKLRTREGTFQTLIKEFGSTAPPSSPTTPKGKAMDNKEEDTFEKQKPPTETTKYMTTKYMLDEERVIVLVSWPTYWRYLRSIRSWWRVWTCVMFLSLQQAATIGNTFWLGRWSDQAVRASQRGSIWESMQVSSPFAFPFPPSIATPMIRL